ncbi:MAG: T9SS type A sorting domain-containing protein [Crocinitomicaceae bacterium]|nr:T9SS type A sorting domain-containing protein [Crocinitomicaceae bacterium]
MNFSYFFFALFTCTVSFSQAQDTLFFEDFNYWPPQEIDSIFYNYDEDGIGDFNGLSQKWFVNNFNNGGSDSTEMVALSSSWLTGYQPGNRNHLRLPGVYLAATDGVLTWESAPALGNLYLDGYTVLISNNPNMMDDIVFYNCDTLMHFAQNTDDDETQFSLGVIHDSFDSLAPVNIASVTQYPGKLKQWSVSLAAYAGQMIYIDFLHNSDDDNLIALDDILITGTTSGVGIQEHENVEAVIYPNPVNSQLTISLNGEIIQSVSIFDVTGKRLLHFSEVSSGTMKLNTDSLLKGTYLVTGTTKQGVFTNRFVKQ